LINHKRWFRENYQEHKTNQKEKILKFKQLNNQFMKKYKSKKWNKNNKEYKSKKWNKNNKNRFYRKNKKLK